MSAPFFSIIIPSFLGSYPHAATGREEKIHRAFRSVFHQTFTDYEVIFVADGCHKSFDTIAGHYTDERLSSYLIPKQKYMSGSVRNFGLTKASGRYIAYLDIDDCLGSEHLQIIHRGIQSGLPAWAFFNDWMGKPDKTFYERRCHPDVKHECGTSNIVHQRSQNLFWPDGYLHDFLFINQLLKISPPQIIPTPEYFVCHVPKIVDI